MTNRFLPALLAVAGGMALSLAALGQARPYIGFVYPAGGQRGTSFEVKLGGQGLDNVQDVLVSGTGVLGKIVEYYKPLSSEEIQLLDEQLQQLKPGRPADSDEVRQTTISKIEKRRREHCPQPQSRAMVGLVFIELAIAPDAAPGQRELRVRTLRGISNPMVFHVGELPEVCRIPMLTSHSQVLGKEETALRRRPDDEIEQRITVPCTLNGQVASGEVNRYRFRAQEGQRLVIMTHARQLIPYVADAVPGWFQPVLALHDGDGKEVAYDDDYRFKPDPVIFFEAPNVGEYLLSIYDSLYRGREDFVYRITIGELPFVTSIFPLGGRVGEPVNIQMKGWNLDRATMALPSKAAGPGIYLLAASQGGLISNELPFALDTLPECTDHEPNDSQSHAQRVNLPVIVNGRVDPVDDLDVFEFEGKAGDTIVAEVYARRLDSPLDSVIALSDATGKLLAVSDDVEDLGSGVNTHHADSYFMAELPGNGLYYLQISDVSRNGGEEFAYRLRVSPPRPDFALRVIPSSLALRSGRMAPLRIRAIRKDGFYGPIKVALAKAQGFSAAPVTLFGTSELAQLMVRTDLVATKQPVNLAITGTAKIHGRDVTKKAVPAEDRMQAFLWRHLVPAAELTTIVYDPAYQPAAKRLPRERPPAQSKIEVGPSDASAARPKFTKEQVAARLRQLRQLYEEGLLMDDFYDAKVAELDAAL